MGSLQRHDICSKCYNYQLTNFKYLLLRMYGQKHKATRWRTITYINGNRKQVAAFRMTQAVSHWPLTAEARFQSQASLHTKSGGKQSGTKMAPRQIFLQVLQRSFRSIIPLMLHII